MHHLFSKLPPEMLNDYMGKFCFSSFDAIPSDEEGFTYPEFKNIHFILPSLFKHSGGCIIYADGLELLQSMGNEAFNIDAHRWHKVKKYIANGVIEYPEITSAFRIMDGRHRILALRQIYPDMKVPVVVSHGQYIAAMDEGLRRNAINDPHGF